MIVAFVGFKGCGKNTAAQPLVDLGYTPVSFADPIKDTVASVFGWPRKMIEGATKKSRIWREEIDPWWANRLGIPDFSPRKALQTIGTDVMREHFSDKIWLLNMERRLSNIPGNAVMTDVRHTNEIKMARSLGGMIYRIRRGNDPVWFDEMATANITGDNETISRISKKFTLHKSEYNWVGCDFDGLIENDSNVKEFHYKVRSIVLK